MNMAYSPSAMGGGGGGAVSVWSRERTTNEVGIFCPTGTWARGSRGIGDSFHSLPRGLGVGEVPGRTTERLLVATVENQEQVVAQHSSTASGRRMLLRRAA